MRLSTTDHAGLALIDKLSAEPDAVTDRRSRELLEALPAAVYTTDADGLITFYNEAAVAFWGYRPKLGDGRWCGSWKLLTADGEPLAHADCPMAVALRTGRPVRGAQAMAERPDGVRVPFIPFPTPLHDAAGNLIGAVNMLVDISEQKEAEARQKLLVDELNHRVKNTLATVQALAALSAQYASSPDAFQPAFGARLSALARAHDLLSDKAWEGADLGELVELTLSPYMLEPGKVTVSGPPVRLSPNAALTVNLGLHEMATNAAKYGAFSVPTGHLEVRWRVLDGEPRRLQLVWRESGVPGVAPPTREGFGTRLIKAVGRELDAVVEPEVRPDGLTFSWIAPTSDKVMA
jgi:PAS domain S-box-containing protein